MTLPVYVCSIAKNEEKHVRRWAESAKDADGIYLLDTGSTDDTIKIAKECGVIVFEKTYEDWSFSVARNDLREMLPDNDAWLINLDLDEVLCAGWRPALDAVPLEFNRPRYDYDWNWTNPVIIDGEYDIEATRATSAVGLSYRGDKIVRRYSHRWVNRVHEVNINVEGHQELQTYCPGLRIQHFADNKKSRGGYLDLLILDVEEDPTNARNTYYLGREFMYRGMAEQSINMLKHHLSLETAWWKPERGFACRYIARQVPEHEKREWLLKAIAEYSSGRECWLEIAQWAHDRSLWLDCYWAAKNALQLSNRGDLYLTEAQSWGHLPHDLAALASYRLGHYHEAIMHGRDALMHSPNDKRLKQNLFFYKNALSKVDVIIPTKNNTEGLQKLVNQLELEEKVGTIIVVGDGAQGSDTAGILNAKVIKASVASESGIHVMWNLGLTLTDPDRHVAFINDDVSIEPGTITKLCAELDANPEYGLVSPVYWDGELEENRHSSTTCRGRYDGTGGIAGFCFVLAADIAQVYRFDEEMKWWYGDDDVVRTTNEMGRDSVLVAGTRIIHSHSATIKSAPPAAFAEIVERDRLSYERKWGNRATVRLSPEAELYFSQLPSMTHRCSADIRSHLPRLRSLAAECQHVTEFGTRYGISTAALICGKPEEMVTYDLNAQFFSPFKQETEALAEMVGVKFAFIEKDVLGVDIDETDLLFIDTYHTYNQLTKELNKHSSRVRKYIVMHDTVTFGHIDEKPYDNGVVSTELDGSQQIKKGLWNALEDFLEVNPDWKIHNHYQFNNGLTVIKRSK